MEYLYTVKEVWDMAEGLQQVDNLTISDYMKSLIDENITDKISIENILYKLRRYYSKNINTREMEADFVCLRIFELMNFLYFNLSMHCLKYVHKNLFQDIYHFSGTFRRVNMTKSEVVLNGDTVIYAPYDKIKDSLEYDITNEQSKNYRCMNEEELIDSIVAFTSNIWQAHPFREGNTRTTAVFIVKYLEYLGYKVDISIFKNNSKYFRDSLARSNYYNDDLDIRSDYTYLKHFFENILLGKNNMLDSKDIVIKEKV